MAIAHVATEYVFSDFLLKEPNKPQYRSVRTELAMDKMVTCVVVGLPLLFISLAFAQEVSVGESECSRRTISRSFSSERALRLSFVCLLSSQAPRSAVSLRATSPGGRRLMSTPSAGQPFTHTLYLCGCTRYTNTQQKRWCNNLGVWLCMSLMSVVWH